MTLPRHLSNTQTKQICLHWCQISCSKVTSNLEKFQQKSKSDSRAPFSESFSGSPIHRRWIHIRRNGSRKQQQQQQHDLVRQQPEQQQQLDDHAKAEGGRGSRKRRGIHLNGEWTKKLYNFSSEINIFKYIKQSNFLV